MYQPRRNSESKPCQTLSFYGDGILARSCAVSIQPAAAPPQSQRGLRGPAASLASSRPRKPCTTATSFKLAKACKLQKDCELKCETCTSSTGSWNRHSNRFCLVQDFLRISTARSFSLSLALSLSLSRRVALGPVSGCSHELAQCFGGAAVQRLD